MPRKTLTIEEMAARYLKHQAKQAAYRQRPEVKAKQAAYFQRPEVKAKQAAYFQQRGLAERIAKAEAKLAALKALLP